MIWYPYQQMKTMKEPYKIIDAQGVWLKTPEREMIDSISSWWSVIRISINNGRYMACVGSRCGEGALLCHQRAGDQLSLFAGAGYAGSDHGRQWHGRKTGDSL